MTARPDAVLGIDVGTSVVKAGVLTIDGVMQATASRPVALQQRSSGRAEQDLDDLYRAAADATRQCLSGSRFAAERIGAIAVAGQMAGVGIVDAKHRPLAPYDSWLDTRCAPVVDELSATLGPRITAVAGCAPTISVGPKMVWWHRHHPKVCADAAAFVTAAGYVAGRAAGLSGKKAFIDPSYLHFTSVADVGRGRWDEALGHAVGIDPDLLPTIVESTSIVGELSAQTAPDFGLLAGTPVAAGCGDTAASALGAGVTAAGQAFDIAGTAAVFGVCLPTFAPDTNHGTLMTMRAALPGRWYSLAYVGGAGQVIEWICREIFGHAALGDAGYAELATAAAEVAPGSDGLIVSPHFSGRIAPVAPALRGAVVGLSPIHHRAHLARAILESIAFEYRRYADIAQVLVPGSSIEEVVGTGGGSRSRVWNQIKADVLSTLYRPVAGVESGTRGAALVAMAALGHDLPPLDPSVSGPVATPDAANRPAYRAAYARYHRWSDRLVEGHQSETVRSDEIGERP
ncbi:MAG TPA: FGGY family carbohydrate kinase [Actinophytocola sp.]|uniref:xylulokinase n=1 Tax=Actinophytocola sp. TaxID=1872138 RepID=UPI002DFC137F|nr:FGGY family carbohydrate kinase [Actinophytocola sp.]